MNPLTSRCLIHFTFQCGFLLLLLILSFGSLSAVRAQDLDNVTIGGRVMDPNGAVIPGATVQAVLVKTSASRTSATDAEGHYQIIQLEPGVYTVRASFAGFAQREKQNLMFGAGQTVQLDISLSPQGVIVDPVLVIATDAPQVDTARTVVGGTVTRQEVESLPVVTRSPLDLIFALPGVAEEPLSTRDLAEDRNQSANSTPEEAGIFSLSGGPAFSNNITIDGLDNNDDRAARERFQPSIDAVEEVQVITNQFSAEYGRASGGRINIRTRGGGPEFRGRGFYFFRDESLTANTFRNNSLGLKRLPLQEHNPGFTFSGPVIFRGRTNPKRTFFFISYEFDKLLDSAWIDTLVPVNQSVLFPLPAPSSLQGRRWEDASAPAANARSRPLSHR
jgi:hypothetical protein